MRKIARLPLVAVLAPVLAFAAVRYPPSKTVEHTDDYHGTKVADPYRWMEDVDSADTKVWVGAQNEATFGFLKNLPKRDAIKQRLTELINYPRYSLPRKEGGRYFYSYNTGLQNQSPL